MFSERGLIELVGEVKRHFLDKFLEPDRCKPILDGVGFKSLSGVDYAFLKVEFSDLEIKEVVWGCDGSKIPSPD